MTKQIKNIYIGLIYSVRLKFASFCVNEQLIEKLENLIIFFLFFDPEKDKHVICCDWLRLYSVFFNPRNYPRVVDLEYNINNGRNYFMCYTRNLH